MTHGGQMGEWGFLMCGPKGILIPTLWTDSVLNTARPLLPGTDCLPSGCPRVLERNAQERAFPAIFPREGSEGRGAAPWGSALDTDDTLLVTQKTLLWTRTFDFHPDWLYFFFLCSREEMRISYISPPNYDSLLIEWIPYSLVTKTHRSLG